MTQLKICVTAYRLVFVLFCMLIISACMKPDLIITSFTATATPSTPQNVKIDFSYTVENRDYEGNLFVRPGQAVGPLHVMAWSSVDGINIEGPMSQYFPFLSDGETLEPGNTISSSGYTSTNIDFLSRHPYLILEVDALHEKNEWNEDNNTKSTLIDQ